MPDKKTDRPWIELVLNTDGLKATWGPNEGPWGIFKDAQISAPQQVNIKEWWLSVGTKAKLDQPEDKDEPSHWEIFHHSMGAKNEMTIPWDTPLPLKQKVLARVIGYFDSKGTNDEPFTEGIFSDVERVKIPEQKSLK